MLAEIVRKGLVPGAYAGLIGGVISGVALSQVGALPATAALVHSDSAAVAFVIHVVVAGIIGAGFGVLVWHQRSGAGETLFWGLTYGALWWFAGPLTLMPLLQVGFLAWDVHSAQEAFGSLLGHLLYGAGTGLAVAAIRRERPAGHGTTTAGTVVRGALAGVVGAWMLGDPLIGLLAGVGFALLYPRPPDGTGPALIRGTVYGFFWWVVGALTLLPLIGDGRLAWSLEDARAAFSTLPKYLLSGPAITVAYQWLDRLVRLLFSDVRAIRDEEGAGTEGLRAVGRGALAGLVGGVVFTGVMVRVGILPVIAQLVGMRSSMAGLVVHLVIAVVIGVCYGLLFRRQSYDLNSALGWGVSYGFFWWILGPLTLMPILLGGAPQWTAQTAAGLFASLVGHLAYGAGLGVVFHLLEARQNPWWIPRTRADAVRVGRRKEQLLTSAPALWALVVAIALVLPVLLGV